MVHLPASVPCLPGAVRWPHAIIRHPVNAARYELIFCLRFHLHMSLPRIVPFITALATRRVGACRYFVYLYSYRHDVRRTHDLRSHAPGGQFRVHVKRSNQSTSLGLNPPSSRRRHYSDLLGRFVSFLRILAGFAYTFFSNPKAHSCRIRVSSERLKRSPGARAFVSSVAGARTSEVGL